ncbi:hypothetical protein SISNIDRAFT_404625 [Sistotremastrum niveocremeum HHB9708]|uniref:U3 small nucleolar RNA-associated protein 6 N-terminal domain-containing protein n=1 Tax=Sistotremastrum niveocremeum HHB9708 TaxID=1314777 RepID=A0A165A1S6_9AGAM|nr:hypothetical protein SISNIDRAFT_404625 [Sistotremastrum niveocremeum HHB9708]
MLAELKDFVEKGMFTKEETKAIVKKRTAYETTLIRRIPRKVDYIRYIEYEEALEKLRCKRVERLDLPKTGPSISSYSITRRILWLHERAVKRFKSDVDLWVRYIRVAQRDGANGLAGRVCARALQMHPNEPGLYVIAAMHELDQMSAESARTILQRGLRINRESLLLWREYVKMEIGFVEGLRRRWAVLGVEEQESMREVLDGGIVRTAIAEARKGKILVRSAIGY